MSKGNSSDPGRQGADVFRRTAVVVGLCVVSAILVYYAGGKAILDAQRSSGTNAEDQPPNRDDMVNPSDPSTGRQDSTDANDLRQQIRRLQEQLAASEPLTDAEANAIESEQARNRVQIVEAYKIGQAVTSELEQAKQEIEKWFNDSAALPKGEVGKRIATFPELVDQYAALLDQAVFSFDDHDRWSQQIEAVFPRIKAAYDAGDNSVVVQADDISYLRQTLTEVKTARTSLRKQHRSLKLLVASAAGADPGQDTLEIALAKRTAEQDAKYLHELATAKRAAADEVNAKYATKLAEEHRKQQELLNQQKLNTEQLATQQRQIELDRITAAVEEIRRKREKAKLIQDFRRDRGTVDSLLAPFLDNAITQPSLHSPISKGGPMRPTSLGALRGSSALEDTRKGLDFLYHVGGHPANMRAKGSFPSFIQLTPIPSESVRARVRQAQQLLVKYGDLMVEEGLLSP